MSAFHILQAHLRDYRYHLLIASYVVITSLAILRVNRQPYSRSIKVEQIETIFKGTTLGAVVLGVGISGKINRARSASG